MRSSSSKLSVVPTLLGLSLLAAGEEDRRESTFSIAQEILSACSRSYERTLTSPHRVDTTVENCRIPPEKQPHLAGALDAHFRSGADGVPELQWDATAFLDQHHATRFMESAVTRGAGLSFFYRRERAMEEREGEPIPHPSFEYENDGGRVLFRWADSDTVFIRRAEDVTSRASGIWPQGIHADLLGALPWLIRTLTRLDAAAVRSHERTPDAVALELLLPTGTLSGLTVTPFVRRVTLLRLRLATGPRSPDEDALAMELRTESGTLLERRSFRWAPDLHVTRMDRTVLWPGTEEVRARESVALDGIRNADDVSLELSVPRRYTLIDTRIEPVSVSSRKERPVPPDSILVAEQLKPNPRKEPPAPDRLSPEPHSRGRWRWLPLALVGLVTAVGWWRHRRGEGIRIPAPVTVLLPAVMIGAVLCGLGWLSPDPVLIQATQGATGLLSLTPGNIDFGAIPPAAETSARFTVRNHRAEDFVLSSIDKSCGCQRIDFPATRIRAGESAGGVVGLRNDTSIGDQAMSIRFTFRGADSGEKHTVALQMSARLLKGDHLIPRSLVLRMEGNRIPTGAALGQFQLRSDTAESPLSIAEMRIWPEWLAAREEHDDATGDRSIVVRTCSTPPAGMALGFLDIRLTNGTALRAELCIDVEGPKSFDSPSLLFWPTSVMRGMESIASPIRIGSEQADIDSASVVSAPPWVDVQVTVQEGRRVVGWIAAIPTLLESSSEDGMVALELTNPDGRVEHVAYYIVRRVVDLHHK